MADCICITGSNPVAPNCSEIRSCSIVGSALSCKLILCGFESHQDLGRLGLQVGLGLNNIQLK